jgi:hypothetical protein
VSAAADDDATLALSGCGLADAHLGHLLALDWAHGDPRPRGPFPRGHSLGPGGWPGPVGAAGAPPPGAVEEGRGAWVELRGNTVAGRLWAHARTPARLECREPNALDPLTRVRAPPLPTLPRTRPPTVSA